MQDIPKLYTALAEWMSCLTMLLAYRGWIEKKERAAIIWKMGISLVLLCILQMFCGMVSNWLWLVGMLAAVLLMICTLKSCIGTGWNGAAYLCARAFLRAEFLAALEWQIYYFYFGGQISFVSGMDQVHGGSLTAFFFCLVSFCLGYGIFYYVETRGLSENFEKTQLLVPKSQMAMVWLTTLLVFGLSNLSYIEVNTPFTGTGETQIFNIRTLMDLAGMLILEMFQMQKRDTDQRQEMVSIQNVLMNHYQQYRESQENIDLLNRKYHDLKHQIQIIRAETDDKRREGYLKEIEQGLNRYDEEIRTGNSVLDTVLTSKNSICRKQEITLTVMADGALLSHLHVMDLCTIFGNALDNAIEYEVQVKEKEKRLIHVKVSGKGNFVCAVVENYYEGDLKPGKGLPLTTKTDRRFHGYGLKSIRYSVGKYGGLLNMDVQDGWFRLEMLLPKGRQT